VRSIPAPPGTSFPTMRWCLAHSQLQAGGAHQDVGGIERTAKAVARMSDAPAPHIQLTRAPRRSSTIPGWSRPPRSAEAGVRRALRLTPPNTTSEDFFLNSPGPACVEMFNIRRLRAGKVDGGQTRAGTPLAGNHSPQFAPVPKPTILDRFTAMTLGRAQRVRPACPGK